MDGITHPTSRQFLREIAGKFRERFLQTGLYVNVLSLMEVFPLYFPKCLILIVPDEELDEEIPTTIEENLADVEETYTIRIKESVYERAYHGSGGGRMHIVHEMAHYLLIEEYGFKPITARSYGNIYVKYTPSSMEWQAKALAGEIMMPYDLTFEMNFSEIVQKCGVSVEAAVKRTQY